MAIRKKTIQSVEEAICENCIYSTRTRFDRCKHTDGLYEDGEFCDKGQWIYLGDKGEEVGGIIDVYWVFETDLYEDKDAAE